MTVYGVEHLLLPNKALHLISALSQHGYALTGERRGYAAILIGMLRGSELLRAQS
jgi:hypothetical protein